MRLTEFTIPSSVTKLGEECFSNCDNLKQVTFADIDQSQLSSIGKNCFNATAIETIVIPMQNIKNSGVGAFIFNNDYKLANVVFYGKSNITKKARYKNLLWNADFDDGETTKRVPAYFPIEHLSSYATLFKIEEPTSSSNSISAYRVTSAQYSTVSLPYTLKPASDCLGVAKFYEEKTDGGLNDNNTTITFSEPESMTQGKPYVFEQKSANDDGTFAPQSQFGITGFVAFALSNPTETAAESPVDGTYLKGSFDGMTHDNLNNGHSYLLQSGTFKLVGETDAWLDAYRAYLDLGENASAKSITIKFDDGETTGINGVKNEADSVKSDGRMYNLQGQRITAPARGQLYIMNGHKYIAQ